MRSILCLALLLAVSGCAQSRQYFRPTERVRGQTMQGHAAAYYVLAGAQGRFGEAKVWSLGAYERGGKNVVEVTLDVHNTSGQPVSISAKDLVLDPVRTRGRTLNKLPPAETGVFKVAPESRASVKVHFLLPDDVSPGEVHAFAFNWRLRNAEQSYAQTTPFREDPAYGPPLRRADLHYHSVYPCSPYDPYCVGFYHDWYPPPVVVPVPIERQERRRVDVRD